MQLSRSHLCLLLLSNDSTGVGLFYSIPTGIEENTKFGLIIFDTVFNQISHHEYEFPFARGEFVINEGILLDKEEMIILASDQSKIPTNPKSKKIPDFKYTLLSLRDGTSKLIGQVPNEGKWIANLKMIINESQIKLVGHYSNIGRFDAHGLFYHQVDLSNNSMTTKHKLTPFAKQILDDHLQISSLSMTEKKQGEKFGELSNFVLKSILRYEDGSILLLSEQTHIFSQYVTTYYYENIIATLLNPSGEIMWSHLIKKDNSKSSTWVYSGYLVSKTRDRYIIIYHDNEGNLGSK